MAITHLTSENFNSVTGEGTVLVDFWAAWCGPCRMQAPILDQLDAQVGETVKICKVDVDECPDIAQKFGIFSIPTLAVMRDGKLQTKEVGVHTVEQLITMLG